VELLNGLQRRPGTIDRRESLLIRRPGFHGATLLCMAICLGTALLGTALPAWAAQPAAGPPALNHGNGRIVLVGDSITGQSRNYTAGFAHQMEWALKATYPDCKPDLVALGGSGAGVTAWLNTEKRARTAEFLLDVKGVPVKPSLDQPADGLVIMLGMNDVLSPYVADNPTSLDQWTENYRQLVLALKERLHPRVIGLATVTMDTEDPASPKNAMIGKLNDRVKGLAAELGCRLLLTGAAVQDVLRQGRRLRPDFHVANDFVHPNEAGHIGIAMAMLRGLGEEQAAQHLADVRLAALLRKTAGAGPTLSYELTPIRETFAGDRASFRLQYWWTASAEQPQGQVRIALRGPGWDVKPAEATSAEVEFVVTGTPEHAENLLTLEASDGHKTVEQKVRISPPWLVGFGLIQPFWSGMKFDPTRAAVPFDEMIRRGEDITASSDAQPGPRLHWTRYYPSVNYTGLDAAGSVDFSAITHAQNFEAGYVARWIHSPRERSVRLTLGTRAFAGALYLSAFLNGNDVYRGQLTDEPRKQKQVDLRLRQGWNALVIKANHCTWQWQFAADLLPAGDDSLDDLRYSIVPQH
jgi:lysophospholipase L1-like esterase